jgi:hypothetical protein
MSVGPVVRTQKEQKIPYPSCSIRTKRIHDAHARFGRQGLPDKEGHAMTAQLKLIDSERTAVNSDRQKALDAALAQIDRAFGKGSAMKLGQPRKRSRLKPSPPARWGSISRLALAACPRGVIIEIFGPESSGKTTLALHVIAEAQKRAARRPLWTRNMRSIRSMPRNWASTLTN